MLKMQCICVDARTCSTVQKSICAIWLSRIICLTSVKFLPDAGERKSKRSRRGRCAVKVSSATLLSELKLHVAQSLDVHPKNCAIYACHDGAWALLTGEDQSLRGALSSPRHCHTDHSIP